jgi:hypothetical protein
VKVGRHNVPEKECREIVIYVCITLASFLHITSRVEQDGKRYVVKCIRVINDLLIFQRCTEANIRYVELLIPTGDLDETRKKGEG